MATYRWTITHANPAVFPGAEQAQEVGVTGPRDAGSTDGLPGFTFRLLDDDGIWYYRGRIFVQGGDAPSLYRRRDGTTPEPFIASVPWAEDEAFGPLWDYGTPNAGCTDIQYRVPGPDGSPVWATA
jgi:hypothetical protein